MWKFHVFRLSSAQFVRGFRISASNSAFSVCSVFLFGSPISVREGEEGDSSGGVSFYGYTPEEQP